MQVSNVSKTQHGPLPPSKWLVCILSAVVEPAASFLPIRVANDLHHSTMGTQLVGDKHLSFAMAFHSFSEELQCNFTVNALRHVAFEHLTLVIHDPTKIVYLNDNLYENHIEILLPVQVDEHLINARLAYLGRKQRTKSISVKQIVSWLMLIPRSCISSSTF